MVHHSRNYKVNGANDSPRGCGAFSYPDNPLVYHLQERFDMDVSMAEDNISREKKIQGHVLILPPEYKRFKASEVEFFDTLVDPPAPFTSEPEVYIGKIGHDGLPVNYGNLVWGQGENRTTVIPVVSKVAYRDVKAGMAVDNSLNINASWDHVHALFESYPLIVHDLDRTRDKFRWDVPVEIRVEIENPILCTIRALESSVNWQGFAARKDSFKDHVTLEDKPAEAKLRSLIDWYLWGDMKNLGELSRIIRNIQMAQVHVVIQNNTSMQIVESRLNNVDFSIEFSNFIKDLMITGNVAFISSEPRGVVDLQENRLVFQRFNLDMWNQVRIAVGISWEVLAKLDTLRFVIRGEYDRAPSILGNMYYTTPMGFPCVMTPDGPAWNPGRFVASRPKDPHPDVEFVVDKAALARGAQGTSTFVQTINLNLDAVKLKLQSLKSIFEASFGDIESLQGDLDKFYRIFDKAIDLGERVKNDGGDRRE
ncbi:MAG: hypothetical protein GYA24_09430 [Candidatus Lokiarchaeota archaeon]|nr:hypothetical protein [Candidatus Lokiarchaeota archaeon]